MLGSTLIYLRVQFKRAEKNDFSSWGQNVNFSLQVNSQALSVMSYLESLIKIIGRHSESYLLNLANEGVTKRKNES